MTLLSRRREEIARERNAQEQPLTRRSLAVRPQEPRPSFLHVQSAIGNHAVGSWLRASAASVVGGDGPAMESWPRGGDVRDLVAFELRPMLRLAGILHEPRQAARSANTLLVPDAVAAADGQMSRSAFLAAMRDAARDAAERGLADSGHSARGCPWIEHYFRYYEQQSAARIEADLLRHLPAASAAASADELLVLAAEHVGASVRHWASTGELVGVPRDLPGAGLVASVQAQLGRGRPLPASARGRMERAFGARFADVRLHTDAVASRLARRLRTRAFAVGPHVAFDRGEYRPGTVVGDAVLAHELAHTLQQRGAEHASPSAATSTPRIENAADSAAAGVMARLWGGGRAWAQKLAAPPLPHLHAGLALASCSDNFSDAELHRYLARIESKGTEGDLDSDNKARAIVRENGKRPGTFPLNDLRVLRMIQEMLGGRTGTDDQNAIFKLLEESKAPRLQFLFTKGLTSKRLRAKLDEKKAALADLFETRFEGGAKALDAGTVQAIPDADLVRHPLIKQADDPTRGFRGEDLEKLKRQGQKLTFAGNLSPLPEAAQRQLLDNIEATASFVLDPKNPDRIAEVQAVQQEITAKGPKNNPDFPFRHVDKPGERIDATDLFHAHVCVPLAVLAGNQRLQELQRAASAFHDREGPARKVKADVREAIGVGIPETRQQSRKLLPVVERHRRPFLEALGPILEALKSVPEGGVNYHTLESTFVRPRVDNTPLHGEHPIRDIFTPLATNRPVFLRRGAIHCEPLIEFSFHVNRRGEVTLLPGASVELVRAFELIHGFEGGPPAAPQTNPATPPAPSKGGKP